MIAGSSAAGRRCARGIAALAARIGAVELDPIALWIAANREVAARLVLAAAREQLVDATWHDGAVAVPGLGTLALAHTHALMLHEPAIDGACEPWQNDAIGAWQKLALAIGCDEHTTARIGRELEDGCRNLALALFAARSRSIRIAMLGADDPRRFDAEHFITHGHPWHPMVKTRLGLGWADNVRLAPELCARAEIATVTVPRALVRRFGDDALESLGFGEAGEVFRLPVLVAQWRRLDPSLRARITRVGAAPRIARSLASLRTVALDGHGMHLKLALDVLTTSARRTVSPMSVANATEVTALVDRVQARDPIARGTPALDLMRERAAAGLDPACWGDHARQLGVIVRDAGVIGRDHIVCAALGERDIHDTLFVERLLTGYAGAPRERAAAMLIDYVAMLVPPVLRMWTAHGIALEPHMQNTLVRVESGRPAGFVVRDLGGIRLHRPRLVAAGDMPSLDARSFIATDDETEAVDKLMHALVHAHLATLLRILARHTDHDEAQGWTHIGAVIDACLRAWAIVPELHDACARDRERFFAPQVRGKALLRMRIADASSDYSYVTLDNPLALRSDAIDHDSTVT